MSSLKELRGRIKSIKSTQKITAAMKMVAAAKLRKSQERAETIRPYAHKLLTMLDNILRQGIEYDLPPVLKTGGDGAHLVLVISAERGLCGSYNSLIIKETKNFLKTLEVTGQPFRLIAIGRKGFDALNKHYSERFLSLQAEEYAFKEGPTYKYADKIAQQISHWLEAGAIGKVTIITGRFKNALMHEVKPIPLVPLQDFKVEQYEQTHLPYLFIEPKPEELLPGLLKQNLSVQIYRMMLENAACEHASRMIAMDSATRNAQEMIQDLQLKYNQTRQAHITNELIEIISGAQAL